MQAWKSHLRSLLVPVPALSPRRYAAAWLADVAQALRGGNGELLPPTRLMFDGSQNADDFRRDGAEFLNYFIGLGGLGTGHRVLEIGCAIGRKALHLRAISTNAAATTASTLSPSVSNGVART